MKQEENGLLCRIRKKRDLLPPKQRKLGDFIIRNYRSLAYVTLAELSIITNTGHGTIVRFAEAVGCKGFSGFLDELRNEKETETSKTLEVFYSRSGGKGEVSPLDAIFELEQSIINETHALIKADELSHAVDKLIHSPSVIIAATGSNAFLAEYAGFFLKVLRSNVEIIKKFDIEEMQSIIDKPEKSVALVFSFPRYPNHTQSIIELLVKRKIEIIGISDSIASPIADKSDSLFVVPQKFLSFIDPYAAVLSLVHALLYAIYAADRVNCRERIKKYNEELTDENLFVRKDVGIMDLI